MDNQTIIERGNASHDLLNNPAFTLLFKELMDHYINSILSSSQEQHLMREYSYAGARALQDIVGVMQQWISMRDQLLEEKE